MRIVHAADIHLDSPLTGLTRLDDEDVAQQLRQATRRALENLVELVVAEQASALVLAGDTYDGDWHDYATGRFFVQQMGRLHDAGIKVFMAAGNHDAESQITRSLTLPPNVRTLDTQAPESVVDDDLGLAVHGQGFPTRDVTTNLVLAYPQPVPQLVNVGILHTAVAGAEGHANYAPCSPEDLERTGYEYLALGHVHEHRIVTTGEHVAAFSGNLQGRHPRETGPKGALVVDLEPGGGAVLRHVPLDVARWVTLRVDVSGTEDVASALERVDAALRQARSDAAGRLLVARVTVAGTTAAAPVLADRERLQEEVRLVADRLGVTIERARSEAHVPSEEHVVEPELLESVHAACRVLTEDHERLKAFALPLEREFGRVLRSELDVDLRDEDRLRELAEEALTALTARLATGEV